MFAIGQTVSHYKLLGKLGAGGMGVVYKAQDTKLQRAVALKFLRPEWTHEMDSTDRFLREALAASRLDHSNICTIHEIDETEDGQLFIVMAYYEGETLKTRIGRGALEIGEAVNIAIQVAQGLAKAHAEGIVHRDIKPANIMLTDDELVKIVDFGIAKLADQTQITNQGTLLGTVAYMSPEQARGEIVDQRTDIWSLGVVLYEMVTGHLPLQLGHEQVRVYLMMNEVPVDISEFRSRVPIELEAILKKAIAKPVEERFQRADKIVSALKAVNKQLGPGNKNQAGTQVMPAPSIAVLPFLDLSQQKDQGYFCDGMAEEITDTLAKMAGLNVASRTSAFAFKGKEQSIQGIGEELKVSHVLEGSVRKAGNKLRINAQLIKVSDGYHLWSEKYDRELEDVFAIQEDIARMICDNLQIKLTDPRAAPLFKRHTENPDAYNLYLKGRYFWNKRFEGGLRKAMEHFNQAIEEEPAYALPYAGLADCYVVLGWYLYLSPAEAFLKAKAAAQKALEIDDMLAEAHTSLGPTRLAYDWDWVGAERELKRALELDPRYPTAHSWYSFCLMPMGQTEESLEEQKRALELDPLSLKINAFLGWMFYFGRQYEIAIEQLHKTLEMDPNFGPAHAFLGWAYEQKQMYEEAIKQWQKARALLGIPSIGAFLGHTYAIAGKRDEAQKMIDELNEVSDRQYVSPYHMAAIYVGLKEKDQAFEWLEKAVQTRDCWLVYLKVDPRFDRLHSDKRFLEVLEKVGFESQVNSFKVGA